MSKNETVDVDALKAELAAAIKAKDAAEAAAKTAEERADAAEAKIEAAELRAEQAEAAAKDAGKTAAPAAKKVVMTKAGSHIATDKGYAKGEVIHPGQAIPEGVPVSTEWMKEGKVKEADAD